MNCLCGNPEAHDHRERTIPSGWRENSMEDVIALQREIDKLETHLVILRVKLRDAREKLVAEAKEKINGRE